MISVSRLLCGIVGPGDELRYRVAANASGSAKDATEQRPIVVWNCTRRCNLHCVHCYANASDKTYDGELSTEEAKAFIRDLSDFGVPVLLFSGGEPLWRPDVFELAVYAKSLGIRPVLSTNGTLITREVAQKIKEIGFGEAGISLDGIAANNDKFRGLQGAYEAALQGIRNCVDLGQKVSLRFTITKYNYKDVPAIFDLVEQERVDRVCFYHLAYVGRAGKQQVNDVSPQETRTKVDLIFEKTLDMHKRGIEKESLTLDNHTDGVYLYQRIRDEQPERVAEVWDLLLRNGGNNSGLRIGAVDNQGYVHADQFWWHYSFGNVRERKFGDIWLDTSDPLMKGLKNRKPFLKGRCGKCQYLDICKGNLRVRAEAAFGDIWAEDPACYLTDQEIEEIGIG
jgi:radical SAM protein with 4Fe4S-binding SPASM domain